ncbi:hypothetical protein ACFGVR_04245 [Mucilaginibacter sp. AW1-3]
MSALSGKIDGQKMRELAELMKNIIPGCGFALIAFDTESSDGFVNYISNVEDDFMIKTLQSQLDALKKGKTFSTPERADTEK